MTAPAGSAAASGRGALPRPLVLIGIPVSGLLLTTFFVFLGFPYDLVARRVSAAVEGSTNMQLRIGTLSPHVGFAGLGLAASDVLAAREGARTISLQEVVVRPAWSFAWFWGNPAIYIDVETEIGDAAGTLTLGSAGGWQGTLTDVQLEYLPLGELATTVDLRGRLTADVDLQSTLDAEHRGLAGSVEFELREGSLGASGLPLGVPFDRLAGRLLFGDEGSLTVEDVNLEGPMISASVTGTVSDIASPGKQTLDLDVAYEVRDKGLAAMLPARPGSRSSDGRSHLAISGTLSHPVMR